MYKSKEWFIEVKEHLYSRQYMKKELLIDERVNYFCIVDGYSLMTEEYGTLTFIYAKFTSDVCCSEVSKMFPNCRYVQFMNKEYSRYLHELDFFKMINNGRIFVPETMEEFVNGKVVRPYRLMDELPF